MSIRKDVLANLAGRVWVALMSFAFVPLYIRFMGIEGYGLIGVFTSMMAIFGLLDLGLGLTVNRELARLSVEQGSASRARTLLRTLEAIYWGVGGLIGLTIALAAPFVAERWLITRAISPEEATRAVRLMGAVAVLRWPVALYLGAMLGLRRQVVVNAITAIGATVAGGGAVLVLWLVSARVEAFFGWQAVAAAGQIALLRTAAWRSMPLPGHRPAVDPSLLRASAGFSAGITGITLLSVVLTQLDKLVLTRTLSLSQFGLFTLASGIAGLLPTAGAAVETAVFPALTRLVAAGDEKGERALYHQASQGMALLVMPAGTALAMFAPELLLAYVGDPKIVDGAHPLLSLMAVGNALLASMFLPLALQLAHGWTKLSLYKNVVAVLIYVPLLLALVRAFGAAGAALAWIALTGGYTLFEVPIMHRRLLRGAQWRWYAVDMGVPLLVSLVALGAARLLLPAGSPTPVSLAVIALAGAVALLGSVLASPSSRRFALDALSGVRAGHARAA